MTIRVVIVDDSSLMRTVLQQRLSAEVDIEVVGTACDAMEARSMIKQLNPDVVTLDIEMPGMDGLSFLEKIMALRPTPVIIVSGATHDGAAATARALQIGAVNCFAKSMLNIAEPTNDNGELVRLVREASTVKFRQPNAPSQHGPIPTPTPRPRGNAGGNAGGGAVLPPVNNAAPELIAVGSSTGGVEALHTLLAGFPADCPPTLIVQHVNAHFAGAIVQSLDAIAAPKVELADSDIMLERGKVWLAPGDEKHLMLANAGTCGWRMVLRAEDKVSGHRPSVDRLFQSVAQVAGDKALGILLTGMGQDGAKELLSMAQTGSRTIAQDEASCVVFGMPRAAITMGAAREVLPLNKIAGAVFGSSASQSNHSFEPKQRMGA